MIKILKFNINGRIEIIGNKAKGDRQGTQTHKLNQILVGLVTVYIFSAHKVYYALAAYDN